MRTLLARPEARRAVFDALRRRGGPALAVDRGGSAALEREVDRRSLVVLERPIAALCLASVPEVPAPAPASRPQEPRRELAWIDLTVVDDSRPAEALQGAQFQLRLPDGSTRKGALDAAGRVRLDDIEPGKCWFELIDPGHGAGA